MFTIYLLTYGDRHLDLFKRSLDSILAALPAAGGLVADLRLGFNDAPAACDHAFYRTAGLDIDVVAFIPKSERANVGKYPLMRAMFNYDRRGPGYKAPWAMWFDDDSWLGRVDPDWWREAARLAAAHAVSGSVYRVNARPGQAAGVAAQPWYTGRPVGRQFTFATGGWWIAQRSFLDRHNWPFPELHHRSGDSILGELCRQQGEGIGNIRGLKHAVYINADPATGEESRSPRRGPKELDGKWIWEGYDGSPPDLAHNRFDYSVFSHAGRAAAPPPAFPPRDPPPLPVLIPLGGVE